MAGERIDIVVPVYNAADDLARCVASVLQHNDGDYRLLLIDDASPDPAIRAQFAELARRDLPQLALFANGSNLGFTLTANRGIALARDAADVVLLNSDAIVTRGWLGKLARCASSNPRIGTITPFSNNAEICSLPLFCVNNPWPADRDPEPMNRALEAAALPSYPDLPTGVGFCLYIRRALIDAIGAFDPAFGLGYGEENDLCRRAAAAGFRNVLCDDTFVVHHGGRSFEDTRIAQAERNLPLLLGRHPDYADLVRDYIAADPVAPLRELALMHYRILSGPRHGVLHVLHGHGGGTEYHVRALIEGSRQLYRHYLVTAVDDLWQLEEHLNDGSIRVFEFRRLRDELWSDFMGGICVRFGIDLVHLHHISGCRAGLIAALTGLDIAFGYTVHDVNFACPTITFRDPSGMFCGAQTDPGVCQPCLAAQSEHVGIDIVAWRATHRGLLDRATFAIAPSQWAADTLHRYYPQRDVHVIAHGAQPEPARSLPAREGFAMPDDDVPVIALLGAVGPDKGARRVERLIELTRERGLRLRWVLIGYLDRRQERGQDSDAVFTVHGRYDVRDLPALIAHYRVRLVAYPSAGPETFSYTLSEAWAAGRPVLVPPIGALAERVAGTGGGWILAEADWLSEERMLERIVDLLAPTNRDAFAAVAARARAAPLPTLAAMAEATVQVYAGALLRVPPRLALPPISTQRCLEALHYAPWMPPAIVPAAAIVEAPAVPPVPAAAPATAHAAMPCSVATPAAAAAHRPVSTSVPISVSTTVAIHSGDWIARLAHAGVSIRHTRAGRVLYRLTPKPLLAALKARLHD